mmetsp:Transcript_11542/g.37887  ORF Transcript_11542/g.37887 Transcript_11542/m.37887 type:complete len:331 (-) Transcript_11542:488-1480(-)
MIARDVERVGSVHARAPLLAVRAFRKNGLAVLREPRAPRALRLRRERERLRRKSAQERVRDVLAALGLDRCERAKGEREIGSRLCHQQPQFGYERFLHVSEPELFAHLLFGRLYVSLRKALQSCVHLFSAHEPSDRERVRELAHVPPHHFRLRRVAVAPPVEVGKIGRIVWIEILEKSERSIVNREAEDGHVIGVEDPVGKAERLPRSHEPHRPLRSLREQLRVRPSAEVRVVVPNDVVGEIKEEPILCTAPARGELERAEAHERGREPRHHSPGLETRRSAVPLVAEHARASAHERQCARRWNAEGVHRLARHKLPQRRSQNRPPIQPA